MTTVIGQVAGTIISSIGQSSAGSAAGSAAEEQRQANIKSAEILEAAGRQAEADLLRAQIPAIESIGLGAQEAEARISPFVAPGTEAFTQARGQILSGAPLTGPLADSIREASTGFITSRPEIFDISGPVGTEVARQGNLSVSRAAPVFRDELLRQGLLGAEAVGDVAGIRQRGLETLADIASTSGAQRASVVIGQVPQLAQTITGQETARLLGDLGANASKAKITGGLARLAGEFA